MAARIEQSVDATDEAKTGDIDPPANQRCPQRRSGSPASQAWTVTPIT